MNVNSLEFVILCGVAAVLYHWLAPVRPRQRFLGVLNLVFLTLLIPNLATAVAFAVFVLGTFGLLRAVRVWPSGYLVAAALALVISAFLIVKKYAFLYGWLPDALWQHPLAMIGISYMLFKFIHMLVDEWQGQLVPFTLLSYANYQLAFFTLSAGPIQRFNNFDAFWQATDDPPSDERTVLRAWDRLLTGIIKMSLLSAVAFYFFDQSKEVFEQSRRQFERLETGEALTQASLWKNAAVVFYLFPVYLYFNFSGYTDIAIGSAKLFGCDLPENFNHPYFARNVIDYWNRWHITLSQWIRDYVFMTSFKWCVERFPRAGTALGYGLMFVSLFLAGVWHGSTTNFAVFGLLNGLGAAVNQIYGDVLKRWLGRKGLHNYLASPWIRRIANVATFHYICFSLLFFAMPSKTVLFILRTIFHT